MPIRRNDWIGCIQHSRNWKLEQWSKVVFTDESWIQSSQFQIQWLKKFRGEIIEEEYNSTCYTPMRSMIWGAIGMDGPLAIHIFEDGEKVNSEVYCKVLEEHLKDIPKLVGGELIF
jgi:hypothetical protein